MHSDDSDERQALLNDEKRRSLAAETAVYARRWYILFVFCLTSFNGALLWNTWGPITVSAEAVFGWNDGDIGMLANYGNIFFIIFVLPLCWFTDVKGVRARVMDASAYLQTTDTSVLPLCWFNDIKGLRWATIVTSLANLVGAGIRCISMQPVIATWTANICAALTGVSGCVCYAAPSLVSSVWFPPNQRATATAAMSLATYFGLGISFIIDCVDVIMIKALESVAGPLIVRNPDVSNKTDIYNDIDFPTDSTNNTGYNITNMPELQEDIRHLLYSHGGLCALCFLLNIIYFPSKPPRPPSVSASVERTEYVKGLRQLVRMYSVWLVVLAYSLPIGILQVWATVLVVNLKPLGIDQTTAGYMGFWQTMAGCAGGMVVSRFSDIFMRRMKLIIILLYVGAAVASSWMTLITARYVPLDLTSLYAACILVGVFVNGAIPLFYEISCEASYPVAEGVTVGWLTLVSNVFGSGFLLVLLAKSLGTSWMNWVLTGSILLALPLLVAFRESYKRTDLDITITVPPPRDISGATL